MNDQKHIEETRELISHLNWILPYFMHTFQNTENMALCNLLNEITPTIIACRQRLETFRDMEINKATRAENKKPF